MYEVYETPMYSQQKEMESTHKERIGGRALMLRELNGSYHENPILTRIRRLEENVLSKMLVRSHQRDVQCTREFVWWRRIQVVHC